MLGAPCASAQKLSLRHYDMPDGLAQGTVQAIHQDAKGYLWFGTSEGLSGFDGCRRDSDVLCMRGSYARS